MKKNIMIIILLVIFLMLLILLVRIYQHSNNKEEQILDIEDKLIYNENEDLILTFAIFPKSGSEETYLITVDKENKIEGFMGSRRLDLKINDNYLTKIRKYNENYLNEQQLNILLDALNKIEYAEIKYMYGFGGNDIIIIYNNKIYETTKLDDPIIEEIINIIKKLSPIEIVMPKH